MELIWQSLQLLVERGLPRTIMLTVALLGGGLLLGYPIAFLQVYGPRPVRWFCKGYEQVLRGIPAIVLILLFHSGLSRTFGILLPAFASGLLALGLRSSAYQSQIFRGAIQSVSEGQMQAARSVGMTRIQAIRHIILPQAFRLSIPPWTNEFSSVLKDTSLVSAVGFLELMKQTTLIYTRVSYTQGARWVLVILMLVALIYWTLTALGNAGLGYLERRTRIPGFEMKGQVER